MNAAAAPPDNVTFAEALRAWARIGVLSFGGPAGQIAMMHRVLVDERKWLSEGRFLHALNFCMLLPGPEAMQLATYAGWLMHGWRGGLAAGLLFVLPGAVVVLVLAAVYAYLGATPLVAALFFGVKAAVLAIVIEALLRIARRALKARLDWAIAGAAFAAIFFFAVPFPLIVIAAAVIGACRPAKAEAAAQVEVRPATTWGRTAATAVLWLALWLVPIAALAVALGQGHVLVQVGWFFSKLAVVTFGGAYAVLAYMAQEVVQGYGWLAPGQMVDGLGLAETTPGPLILVTEFVGFLAGFQDGNRASFALALAAAAVTLWVTFAPCFLWIFVGAPHIERLRSQGRAAAALSGVTAAVVGVILNLSLWFGLHVFFAEIDERNVGILRLWVPGDAMPDWAAVGLFGVAALALFRLHLGILPTLGGCAALGLVLKLLI